MKGYDRIYLVGKDTVKVEWIQYNQHYCLEQNKLLHSSLQSEKKEALGEFNPLTDDLERSALLNKLFQTVKSVKKIGERGEKP
jgi:hypothetical protein